LFGICVENIWQANSDVQFILDCYVIAKYCTSYLTKIDKTITKELKALTIINCNENKIEANIHILKMGYTFLNSFAFPIQKFIIILVFYSKIKLLKSIFMKIFDIQL
jgi:hypothetical protein